MSSCVLSGFEAQSESFAPPAISVRQRFAVSAVTCRHAASVIPFSGFSLANRSRTMRSTGISRSAQRIRLFPSPARDMSFTSYPAFTMKTLPNGFKAS